MDYRQRHIRSKNKRAGEEDIGAGGGVGGGKRVLIKIHSCMLTKLVEFRMDLRNIWGCFLVDQQDPVDTSTSILTPS